MKLFEKKKMRETPKVIDTLYTWESERKSNGYFGTFLIGVLILVVMAFGYYKKSEDSKEFDNYQIPIINEDQIEPDVDYWIKKKSKKYDVDFILIKSIIQHESRHFKYAKGVGDDVGVMQVRLINMNDIEVEAPFEYDFNIDAGTRYLRKCLDKYPNLNRAISCYNMGLNGNYNSVYVKRVCDEYIHYFENVYNSRYKRNYIECKKI